MRSAYARAARSRRSRTSRSRSSPATCLLVVGPSGSGKSTLALALAGLVPRELPGEWHGQLRVDGLDPVAASGAEVAARVGLVFQDPESQIVMERVEDDVAFGLESRGWPRDAMRARVPEALAEVGLGGLERRRTTRLSGGQQQRLALAGALAPRPGILVLDEPTANLDPPAAEPSPRGWRRCARHGRSRSSSSSTASTSPGPSPTSCSPSAPDGRPIDVGRPEAVLARSRSRIAAAGAWLPDEDASAPATAATTSEGGAARAPSSSPPTTCPSPMTARR